MNQEGNGPAQAGKAGEVKKAFEALAGGLARATQDKITEYTLRALRGESVDVLTQGLPSIWKNEVNKRVSAIGRLQNEEEVWADVRTRVGRVSAFDRKAFEYCWRIIKGADRQGVLQGLPPSIQGRVGTYLNETLSWAVEKASKDTGQGTT
jgi:hypothetical protein